MANKVEVKDVSKVYKRGKTEFRALDGISLLIREGEFLSVMGPSGSGKSTLLHLIGALDHPSAG
ncbi:MAG TPA: ATP-binding cassette domain-containing protein, partial [Anaerolineae bacterium]|nr:ATP-binding cassette domain-containing protein [Anaerolineae bacterium]